MSTKKTASSHSLMNAFREFIYDASESELDDALRSEGEDPEAVYLRGRSAIEQALSQHRASSEEEIEAETPAQYALREGLGSLVRLLRKKEAISIDELAEQARIDVREATRLEVDDEFRPSPRTLVQLENYFGLESKTLILLSGSISSSELARCCD